MALLAFAFFLGLMVGIGFWFWQQTQLQRQLRQLLRTFHADASEISLPMMPRLRREIALQEQQQQKLRQQVQTWKQLLQVAPLGYLQVDEENRLLWCNEQAQQLLYLQKWQPGQLRLLLELVRSYELDQLIEQTRDQQQPKVREWVFHTPYADATAMGRARSLTFRASSWPLPDGQVGIFLENRQPLVELLQARDHWVSDLAHELRTPLTSIKLVVETLQSRVEPSLRRWVERLTPEVDRLINLVQTWLELNQLGANPSKYLNRQPVEVRSLIHSVWQTLEPLARKKQLNLSYSGPEAVWVGVDKSRITQVFLNLLDNSIKYSPESETICVQVELRSLENSDNRVQIDIIDSGPGFPNSDLPYVFERLYRGDAARTRPTVSDNSNQSPVSSGIGLGLAIVRQIVLAHGGSIKAMNHPDTDGAWLQVELPDNMADSY